MSKKVVQEMNLFELDDETGELTPLSHSSKIKGSQFGEGWIVVYKKSLDKLVDEQAPYTAMKIYCKLMGMQDFGPEIRVQNKFLYESLGITAKAYYKALKWLEDRHFIKRTVALGQNAFVLNPSYTACGKSSLDRRKFLWSMKAPAKTEETSSETTVAAMTSSEVKVVASATVIASTPSSVPSADGTYWEQTHPSNLIY